MMTIETSDSPASSEAMRHAMVASQLRTSGVSDSRVVAAMAQVPREAFMPEDARASAYRDTSVSLGCGRHQNTPLATARLLTEARILPGDKVLLIGAGTGYTAAVLALLARSVVAVESDATLANVARNNLAGIAGIELVEGALEAGAPSCAPYDVIVVDGAVERFPEALAEQARPGGRIVSGLVDRGVARLAAGERTARGFGLLDFADIDCAILPGFAHPRSFRF